MVVELSMVLLMGMPSELTTMIPCTPFWLWIRFSVSSTSALFVQPSVCTLVPPFLYDLSSYFPSAFFLHSFMIIILEFPSLLLPKSPAEGLQLGAAVRLLQFRCQTKIIFENVHGIYEKSRKKIHYGCNMTFPFIK